MRSYETLKQIYPHCPHELFKLLFRPIRALRSFSIHVDQTWQEQRGQVCNLPACCLLLTKPLKVLTYLGLGLDAQKSYISILYSLNHITKSPQSVNNVFRLADVGFYYCNRSRKIILSLNFFAYNFSGKVSDTGFSPVSVFRRPTGRSI